MILSNRFEKAASITFNESLTQALEGLQFRIDCPHTYCRICGEVFQTSMDREQNQSKAEIHRNTFKRKEWSRIHAKTHTDREHLMLALSGLWVTPDAAYKLEGYGIHTIGSATLNENVEAALREAPSTPQNDVEGSR